MARSSPTHRLVDPARLAARCKAQIDRRFAEDVRLTSLADTLGCSPAYLSRAFSKHVGVTVSQYRLIVRLSRALLRLSESNVGLAELAADLGFSHHSHLTAACTRMTGVAPSEFRRVLRGDGDAKALRQRIDMSNDMVMRIREMYLRLKFEGSPG